MHRLKVVLREEAISDLANIYTYIAQVSASPVTALGFVHRIKARCQRIGIVPMGGRPRDDLHPGLRTVPTKPSTAATNPPSQTRTNSQCGSPRLRGQKRWGLSVFSGSLH